MNRIAKLKNLGACNLESPLADQCRTHVMTKIREMDSIRNNGLPTNVKSCVVLGKLWLLCGDK